MFKVLKTAFEKVREASLSGVKEDFFYACQWGNIDVVQSTLKKYPQAVRWQDGAESNNTALHHVMGGMEPMNVYLKMGKLLVQAGADVNARNALGMTPLNIAMATAQEEKISLLLERNADVNIADDNDATPLMRAARYGRLNPTLWLVDLEANVYAVSKSGKTALKEAQENKQEIIADILKRKMESIERDTARAMQQGISEPLSVKSGRLVLRRPQGKSAP